MAIVKLPDPNYLDADHIIIEEFETLDEALEWAQDFMGADEEGKIQIVFDEVITTDTDSEFLFDDDSED